LGERFAAPGQPTVELSSTLIGSFFFLFFLFYFIKTGKMLAGIDQSNATAAKCSIRYVCYTY
jgi:hypothetical protein